MSVESIESADDVVEARARVFRALGDETRLGVFLTLADVGEPLCVSEICERTGHAPNLVSHHLGCLRNCALVEVEQDGRRRFYEVRRPECVELVALADECIRGDIEGVLGCEVVG